MNERLFRLVDRLVAVWPFLASPLAAWIAWLGYAGVIFYLSSRQFGPILAGLPPNTDKLIHMVEYAGFGAITYHAVSTAGWAPHRRWRLILVIMIGIAYGASDEFHQMFVPTRDSDVRDVMADAVGTAIGAWLMAHLTSQWKAPNRTTSRESIEK
ncbi:MAG TPA: VanZ family protein [Nitrospiria bacterium]|nr:VanZ family protein [Nitrospiria bacterium]